ncbi:uncharacterized protein LOC125873490 [Solanum stenotomum]|uniref:uncharacterized protein LOC125873490 n=1 Tax=Solanum stenotomum TaxID=172797 RepID=UPI0020D1F415|nr:uncharacterized protein LOC125873490 [Solanum stenotomum]
MTNSNQVNVGTVSAATTSVAYNRSTAALALTEKPRFINENVPIMSDETPVEERFLVTEAWTHSDFLCKNYILSSLQDVLYNVYSSVKTSKELWDALEKKYKTKDAGMKKFIVAKFLDYKKIDSKTVVTQVQEPQVIIHDLLAEDLMVRLRIKEDNKAAAKRSRGNSAISEVNIVEEDPTKSKKSKKASGPKSNPPKKKFNENCFNCGKRGHRATECRGPKEEKKNDQANLFESKEEMNDLCAILSECNLVENLRE